MIFKSFHQLEEMLGKVLEGKKYKISLRQDTILLICLHFSLISSYKSSLTTESNAGVPLEEGEEVSEG